MSTSAFGRNIKCLREERDMTQAQLANAISVSEVSIYKWEKGEVERPKQADVREKLKDYFGVSESDLFGYNDGYYAKKYGLSDAPAGAMKASSETSGMVPVRKLGAVHAGNPDEAWEFDGEAMLYDKLAAKHPNCYALQVNGTCMNLNFTDRDTIFVDPDMQPRDGSIAVVSIDGGEVLVRRIRMGNNSIMFIAETTETEAWEDIIIQGGEHDVRLIGTVFWWQSTNEGE